VDGTLIEAWASQKSFHKDGSDGDDGTNFHAQTRKNDTHVSNAANATMFAAHRAVLLAPAEDAFDHQCNAPPNTHHRDEAFRGSSKRSILAFSANC
jgi:hypothetical protein